MLHPPEARVGAQAGGFSPNPLSIAGYQCPAIEWSAIVFMLVAGANFALQYRVVLGNRKAFVADEELRAYLGVVLLATLAMAVALLRQGLEAPEAVRHGAFQVVSILTTTGFASVDFQFWNDQAKIVLLLLMFVGGCAGSAAGGPKVVRHLLMARYTLREHETVGQCTDGTAGARAPQRVAGAPPEPIGRMGGAGEPRYGSDGRLMSMS